MRPSGCLRLLPRLFAIAGLAVAIASAAQLPRRMRSQGHEQITAKAPSFDAANARSSSPIAYDPSRVWTSIAADDSRDIGTGPPDEPLTTAPEHSSAPSSVSSHPRLPITSTTTVGTLPLIQSRQREPTPTFVENLGQWDPRVHSQLRFGSKTLWLTSTGIVFDSTLVHSTADSSEALSVAGSSGGYQRLVFVEEFVGANAEPTIDLIGALPGTYNYLIGSDSAKWHTGVRAYAGVTYRNVWDGVDLKLYGKGADLEQEFVVHSGADLTKVRISYQGIDRLEVAEDGSLVVWTAEGNIRESRPRIYQEIAGRLVTVEGRYKLTDRAAFTFDIGSANPEFAVVIDPTLLYSTFLGGGAGYGCGPFSCVPAEGLNGIAVDSSGNAYVTGFTPALDFPATPGAFQTVAGGSFAFVTKLDPVGNELVYSTYLGATGPAVVTGNGIAVDSAQQAYIAGDQAQAGDFPITPDAYEQSCPRGFFLTKLNSSGTDLIYSTCFGSARISTRARAVAIDSTGKAYIAGNDSTGGLPITAGAYQSQYAGGGYGGDAFLTVFDPSKSGAASLVYSSYLGGTDDDGANAVAVDGFGMAYVTGYTKSQSFPVTSGAFQTVYPGALTAGFVAKFNPAASGVASLIYSSYLGGNGSFAGGQDIVYGIAVDCLGQAHVTGLTGSANVPTTSGAFQRVLLHPGGFVTTLNAGGNGLVQSTFLAGSNGDANYGSAIALDSRNNAYVTGVTGATDFPVTPDAFQSSLAGYLDAFITKVNTSGTELLYSSYLGANQREEGSGIAIDAVGDAYVSGYTESATFPVTQGAFQLALNPGFRGGPNGGGPADGFVTKLPLASLAGLSVTGVTPNFGGNAGTATITIVGSGFHSGATTRLSGGGAPDIVGTQNSVGLEGRTLRSTFDLLNASIGARDLILSNSDSSTATLGGAFTIQQGGAPDLRIQKIGTVPVSVNGYPTAVDYAVIVQNQGSVDALGSIVTESLGAESILSSVDPPGVADVVSPPGNSFVLWPVPLGPQEARVLRYSTIETGSVGSTVVGGPACYMPGPGLAVLLACLLGSNADCAEATAKCGLAATAVYACFVLHNVPSCLALPWAALGCVAGASKCHPPSVASCQAQADKTCNHLAQLLLGRSSDPNYLVGVAGVGSNRWVSGRDALGYAVHFENEPTATAPAAEVVVAVPVDGNGDLTTLSVAALRLPGLTVPIGEGFSPRVGVNEVSTSVDLRPGQQLLVQISAKLDPIGHSLTWTLTSIDPATGQPVPPGVVGFLAPGAEGTVFFAINPREGLPTGTHISHQGSIVFDTNSPVATQVWTNTLDSTPPTSSVLDLPSAEPPTGFSVSWSGSDVGSGVKEFTVFVSDNGGPFTAWQSSTAATSATFTGEFGHTYGFFSIARDLVGNVEAPKVAAEATTRVGRKRRGQ
jgi:hypothetical protein